MIAGQMAICRFPLWEECLESLKNQVDKLYLRFDLRNGDPKILKKLRKKDVVVYCSGVVWNGWNWREEMMRMLDNVKPELVLVLDEDEKITPEIKEDYDILRKSKHYQMAFNYKYPMPSVDEYKGKEKPYPSKPHTKLYKWKSGLTFYPYKRRARLTNFGKESYCKGNAEILHYCFYNEEIRSVKIKGTKEKIKWSKKRSFL